jgi:hypothetical protein
MNDLYYLAYNSIRGFILMFELKFNNFFVDFYPSIDWRINESL